MFKTKLQSRAKGSIMQPMQASAKAHTPTSFTMRQGDARELDWIPDASIHLVVTSPPYWTLKRYPENDRQLGHVADYEHFHDELDKVWKHCFRALVPGGRIVCVVGDVCLSRRNWTQIRGSIDLS
jgi:DNA modification methylase